MSRRNLKYIMFTKAERNRIADLINCGAMKGVEIVDGNEITIKTDSHVGHLYNYRDMDEPQHPRLFRTEIVSNDSESHGALFGNTLDVKVTDPINHFYTFLPIKYVLLISCFIAMHCSCVSKNCNLMSLGLV